MKKKRFTFCIDPEPMERLQGYLQRAGIPMSQYFNAFVIQTLQGLDALKIPQDPSMMTLGDANLLIGRIALLPDDVKVKIDYLVKDARSVIDLSLIHISEPTRLGMISYAVFCLKK